MFQLENAHPCKLFYELVTYYLNVLQRVAKINLVDMTQWFEIIDFDVTIESNHLPLSWQLTIAYSSKWSWIIKSLHYKEH